MLRVDGSLNFSLVWYKEAKIERGRFWGCVAVVVGVFSV